MGQRTKGPRYYTTGKSAQAFVGEIMTLLGEYGAESFHVQQTAGGPVAVAFVMRGVPYQLTPRVEGVRRRLGEAGVLGQSGTAEPEAVAWAQTRHLIEMLLESVESGLVTPAQAFGGLALTSAGRTVADMIEERAGELMPGETPLLPSGQ